MHHDALRYITKQYVQMKRRAYIKAPTKSFSFLLTFNAKFGKSDFDSLGLSATGCLLCEAGHQRY